MSKMNPETGTSWHLLPCAPGRCAPGCPANYIEQLEDRIHAQAYRSGMTLDELQDRSWRNAEDKGFHGPSVSTRTDTLLRLCLIHSEVSEAVQEVKRGWTKFPPPEVRTQVAEELADILIRVGDLSACLGMRLDTAVREKMRKNELRPHRYGTPEEEKATGEGV